jgi:DNA-binding transcriptional LysR family regulator
VTRRVQRLERQIGAPLFTRTHEGVRLTHAGLRFSEYARETLARYQMLLQEIGGSEAPLTGELRIAASTTPAEFIVPPLVAAFTTAHPEVRATVFTTDSQAVVEEMLDGHWDVGFVGALFNASRLRFDPIAEDEVVLAVPARHPLACRAAVAVEDLAEERFVEREGGSGTLMSLRRALAERGVSLPPHRVAMTLNSTQAIVSAVRSGYGVGFVSSLALAGERDGRVVGVRLVGPPVRRKLYLVRPRSGPSSPVAARFIEQALGPSQAL